MYGNVDFDNYIINIPYEEANRHTNFIIDGKHVDFFYCSRSGLYGNSTCIVCYAPKLKNNKTLIKWVAIWCIFCSIIGACVGCFI